MPLVKKLITAVGQHITNIVKDPYNPIFMVIVEYVTRMVCNNKDGMLSTYDNYIRTRCRGKNYEITN